MRIRRDMFEEDGLSQLLFAIELTPMLLGLRNVKAECQLGDP